MVMSAPMREGNRLEDLKPAGVVMNQPVIETERFVLRPLRPSDAGMIAHYTSDRRVAQGTRAIPHPLPPGAAEDFVARALSPSRTEDVWAIDGSVHRWGSPPLALLAPHACKPARPEPPASAPR